ncbi:hypothetical protein JOC86_004690 [Bacillus pakistanensis]|uniref:Uncharacterized protein n=1 Tax=Rossellomorea pakistanensis TaxID=992288 RepID=A0ABS2NJX2_9BACI|nr:hypothetical protein [Bacillus pakistanensis]
MSGKTGAAVIELVRFSCSVNVASVYPTTVDKQYKPIQLIHTIV